MAPRIAKVPNGGGCLLGVVIGAALWLLLWRACA